MLVPLVQWLPSLWVANLLYLSYLPLKLKFNTMPAYRELSLHYHREIQSYVEDIQDRKVVLTGHSLGGGIGKVVAARLLFPCVAISAPGIALSHKLFDVPRENVDKFEVNLISAEDLVPKVDRLKGLIMKMHCTKSNPLSKYDFLTKLILLFPLLKLSSPIYSPSYFSPPSLPPSLTRQHLKLHFHPSFLPPLCPLHRLPRA